VTRTKSPAQSPLAAAVHALDEELANFAQLAQSAQRVPLTSERNVEKAARAINEAAQSQQRVVAHIQALVEAIAKARQEHDATAEALVATRDQVQARGERFGVQLGKFAALGQEAAAISAEVRELGGKGEPSAAVVATLAGIKDRLGRVVDGAGALGAEAASERMEDLARQCDALEQQVRSALNKVTLLHDKLAATV
jgi:hypothetical protein